MAKISRGNDTPTCAPPSTDQTINICFPNDGDTFNQSQPINVQASAFASAGVKVMEVYLDHIKADTLNGADQLATTIILEGSGSHRLTVLAKDGNGTTFTKTIFINAP